MKAIKFILLAALAAFFLVIPGCGQDKEDQEASPKAKTSAPLPETISITGQVMEILDAGNFIFVMVSSSKKIIWATVPKVEVEIGETITMKDANLLENFHSKVLNRTFREVLFSPGIEGKTPIIKTTKASSADKGDRQMRRSQRMMPPPR
jgi:hypothetical protein